MIGKFRVDELTIDYSLLFCYNNIKMNSKKYVRGFLFHPPSGKILLKIDKDTKEWSLFSNIEENEANMESFQKIIFNHLKIKVNINCIKEVYFYERPEKGEIHYVFYAVLENSNIKINPDSEFGWFNLKEISKMKLQPQVRQDINIGARVIRANYAANEP